MFQVKDEAVYTNWKNKNADDDYSAAIFRYCEYWAILMEAEIAQGRRLADIAKATSQAADIEGISGFMYGMAVSVLSQCWIHGETLRKWHNKEYDAPDAKGTVNPALMSIEYK